MSAPDGTPKGRRRSSAKLPPIDTNTPVSAGLAARLAAATPGVKSAASAGAVSLGTPTPKRSKLAGELTHLAADLGLTTPSGARSLPIPGLTGKGKGQAATHAEIDRRRRTGGIDDIRRQRRQKRYDLDPDMSPATRAMYELSDILKHPNGMHSHVEAASHLEHFTELDLSGKWMRDSGLRLLGMIMEGNQTIRILNLARNDLSGAAIAQFCRSLETTKVRHIDLKQNRIKSDGAAALAEALPRLRLKSINVFRNSITKKGIAALAKGMRVNMTVHTLDVSGNRIAYGPHVEAMEDTVFLRSISTHVELATGTISTRMASDTASGCKRQGLHMSKYTDGRRLESRWKDGHIVTGRMHYPNGDTFEIEEGGEDGVPAHGTYHMMLIAKQRWYRKLMVVAGSSIGMVDFGTDVNVILALTGLTTGADPEWELAGISIAIVVFSILVSCRELWQNGRRWAVALQLICATALYDAIQMVRGSQQKVRSFDLHQKECMLGYASINQLKLTEALVESAPQSFISLYIALVGGFSTSLILSISLSLASLAMSLVQTDVRSMTDYVRAEHSKELTMSWFSCRAASIILYRLFEVATRSLFVAMFASVFGIMFAAFVGTSYLVMYCYWWVPALPFTKRLTTLVTKFRLIWYSMLAFPGTLNVCPAWIKKEERLDSWAFFAIRFCEEAVMAGTIWFFDDPDNPAVPNEYKLYFYCVAGAKYVLLPAYMWAVHSATRQSILGLAKSIRVLGAFSTALGEGSLAELEDGEHGGNATRSRTARAGKAPAEYGVAASSPESKQSNPSPSIVVPMTPIEPGTSGSVDPGHTPQAWASNGPMDDAEEAARWPAEAHADGGGEEHHHDHSAHQQHHDAGDYHNHDHYGEHGHAEAADHSHHGHYAHDQGHTEHNEHEHHGHHDHYGHSEHHGHHAEWGAGHGDAHYTEHSEHAATGDGHHHGEHGDASWAAHGESHHEYYDAAHGEHHGYEHAGAASGEAHAHEHGHDAAWSGAADTGGEWHAGAHGHHDDAVLQDIPSTES